MTGWSIELVLLLATVITVIYALIGGLEAIWADVIQCIIANLIFTAWATLTMGDKRILNLGHFNFPWHDYMIGAIGHVVLMVVGYGVSLAGSADPQPG